MAKLKQYYLTMTIISLINLMVLPIGTNAQELPRDKTRISCLKQDRIQNIDIIDNNNIVFEIGTNDYYLNTLPNSCNGLKLNDSILYSTSTNEICDLDVVSVVSKAGRGIQTGPSCGLGKFKPISKKEIETLKESVRKK